MAPAASPAPGRVATLDAVRGVAVVLMVAWHATDGWLAEPHKAGLGWAAMRVAGGLAAPLFLFAAGMGVGLGARRERGVAKVMVRGLELVVLGHALRLAQWAIDRGAVLDLRTLPALLLGVAFAIAALYALRGSVRARTLAALAALFGVAHVLALLALGPALARIILRFDVLHCIGVSCAACTLVAAALRDLTRGRASLAWAPSAILVAVAAALVVSSVPLAAELDRADGLLAWIARGRELRRVAPFPLLPWTGYAMLGCAAALAPLASGARRGSIVVFALALSVALVSFEGGFLFTRSILGHAAWARPIARLAFAAGAAVSLACLLRPLAAWAGGRALTIVGRASLAIYALHLFVAYGKLARPIKHALDPVACAVMVLALIAVCTAGALLAARGRGGERAHTPSPQVGSSANSSA